jgi:AmmeMemoRadiSam system protein B
MPVPRLRPLDLVATEWNGQQVVCARDYEGLLPSPVLLPLPVVLVASLLDGRRDLRDVQAEYARLTGGALLPSWDLDRIVRDLDAHGLLDSPALEARRREVAAAFRAAPSRAAAHAGVSYPAEPDALAEVLVRYLNGPPGDGGRDGTVPGAACEAMNGLPRGLLAPHIDFGRGGRTYGRAYRTLADLPDGACVVILGVAHAGPPAPYTLTTKGYDTPFGTLEVDRQLLDAVLSSAPCDTLAHEPVHRTEHSIEFQAVFLAHLTRGRRITILPVLTGSLDALCGGASPSTAPEIEGFIAALRQALAALDRPVCVVGGVDLSHVGPRFGDAEPVGPALAAQARAFDLGALERVVAGDAEGFWRIVAADGNRRRVCGLGAIYTVLRLLEPVRGRLLDYDQGVDPAGGLVGFSAVVFSPSGDRPASVDGPSDGDRHPPAGRNTVRRG